MKEQAVCDLGRKDGPLLVFGGPYSNLPALEALLDEAASRGIGPDQMICTGDMVAYCADALACVERLRELKIPVVKGNCEAQLAEGAQDCGCGFDTGSACELASRNWFAHANAQMTDEARAFMAACPDIILFEHHGLRVAVLHGGVSARNLFLWETDPDTVFLEELDLLEGQAGPVDLVLAGHSGLAFERKIGRVRWVNCGTIGLPANRGRAETEFAVLKGGDVSICALAYDVERTQAGMRAAGLTQGYEQSLITGYWPNEDILPIALRRVPA